MTPTPANQFGGAPHNEAMPRLDRNINSNGQGKYALVKLRKVRDIETLAALDSGNTRKVDDENRVTEALNVLEGAGVLDYGTGPGTPGDFFVIRLGDKFAGPALAAYAVAASEHGTNAYADDVATLSVAAFNLAKTGQAKLPD